MAVFQRSSLAGTVERDTWRTHARPVQGERRGQCQAALRRRAYEVTACVRCFANKWESIVPAPWLGGEEMPEEKGHRHERRRRRQRRRWRRVDETLHTRLIGNFSKQNPHSTKIYRIGRDFSISSKTIFDDKYFACWPMEISRKNSFDDISDFYND